MLPVLTGTQTFANGNEETSALVLSHADVTDLFLWKLYTDVQDFS